MVSARTHLKKTFLQRQHENETYQSETDVLILDTKTVHNSPVKLYIYLPFNLSEIERSSPSPFRPNAISSKL